MQEIIILQMFGAKVIEPDSADEEKELKWRLRLFEPFVLWLGINDLKKFGHFVKDSNEQELKYSNWATNEPHDNDNKRGRKNCAVMPMVGVNLPDYLIQIILVF